MQDINICQLPVKGLTSSAQSLEKGGVYFILSQSRQWGDRIVKTIARSENWLVLTSKHQAFSEQELNSYPRQILKMPSITAQNFYRILDDIRFYGDTNTHGICLLIDAQEWISIQTKHHSDILKKIKNWALKHKVSILFVLENVEKHPKIRHQCHQNQIEYTGLVSVEGALNEGRWHIWHWFGNQTIAAEKHYQLFINQGLIEAEYIDNSSDIVTDIMDRDNVYYLRQAIFKDEHIPEHWQVLSELTSIFSSELAIQAAYIILPYSYQSPAAELTKLVFELRKKLGPLVKIIVRETDARMRHADERILAHFGATLVVPSSVTFSRFIGILESVRSLKYEKYLGAEEAFDLDTILSNNWIGFLQGTEFSIAVKLLTELSAKFGVQLTLIEIIPAAGLTPQNLVNIGKFRRSGDICTVVQNALYVCLFGCRDNDVERALQFIFGLKVEHLAARKRQGIDIDYIEHVIANYYLNDESAFEVDINSNHIIGLESKHTDKSTHKNWGNTLPAKNIGHLFGKKLSKVTP